MSKILKLVAYIEIPDGTSMREVVRSFSETAAEKTCGWAVRWEDVTEEYGEVTDGT